MIETIKQLASEGYTRQEIADKIGLSYNRTTEMLRVNGIEVVRKKIVRLKQGPRGQDLYHKQRDDEIVRLRQQGVPQKDIADCLGISLDIVKNACRSRKITEEQEQTTEEQAREIVKLSGFEYVSGFKNTHSNITVRCNVCGETFTRLYCHIRKKVNGVYSGELGCPYCIKAESQRRKEQLEQQKAIREQIREQLIEQNKAIRESLKINERLLYLLKVRKCKNCGHEYCIQITGYDSKQYCSEKCSKRFLNRNHVDKRLHIIKSRKHDNDITLERVYNQDNGICYLCHTKCDWDDIESRDGIQIAGNHYPSIDHVKPLSKGGTHTWGNVRLACRICNTVKGAS